MRIIGIGGLAALVSFPAFAADTDRDGLDDLIELTLATDPTRADTDADRFSDGAEVQVLGTDPLVADPMCEWAPHPIVGAVRADLAVDLDNDGDPEVVEFNGRWVNAWENLGVSGFAKHVVMEFFGFDIGGVSARAGDLDGDGLQDLVIGSFDGLWTVRNQGGFVFGPPLQIAAVDLPETLAVEDLDRDGDLDVVLWENSWDTYQTSEAVQLRNLGDGRFGPPKIFDSSSGFAGLTTGDLQNDGWPDVIASDGYKVWWYQNLGPPGFTPRIPICIDRRGPGDVGEGILSVADLDGDGWLDVFYPDTSRQRLTVLWNGGADGGNAFGPTVLTEPTTVVPLPYARNAAPADVDGDGDLDVFVQQIGPTDQLGWIENRGGRTLGPVQALVSGRYAPGISAVDMDLDGDADLLAPGDEQNTAWMENAGAGDVDADALDARDEVCFAGSDPRVADTDGGGVVDGIELSVGRSPLDRADDGDLDRDGYPVPLDCDDADPMRLPGAPEVCANLADDDCDDLVDEGC